MEELSWLKAVLRTLLCQVFQRFALEGDEEIRQLLHEVRQIILSSFGVYLSLSLSPPHHAPTHRCGLMLSPSVPLQTSLTPLTPYSLHGYVYWWPLLLLQWTQA